ncbi:MAG: hypothetical protein SA339_09685 [Methanomassiliicoccus sp.]|nr:hypothetical protein [Methanomassiliicoccus sp.]
MKRWDRRALEGLPLRLLIMSLLVSLTVPVVMGSVESYERSTARSMLVSASEHLLSTVEETMSAGEGNRRIIVLTLPWSVDRYLLALEVGGELERPSSMTIRCTCDGLPFATMVPEDPPARMTSSDMRTLRLVGGEHRLSVECAMVQGRMVAVVEVVG